MPLRRTLLPRILALAATALLLSAAATPTSIHPESEITLPAIGLPEFKTNPHVKESQGNQISGVVRTIHQDSRGHFWFGTQNGLARHDGESLVYFDLRDVHDQQITVKAIAEDSRGNVWIGSTGGLTKYDGTHFTTWTARDGLASDDVWCVTVDRSDTVWIGTIAGVSRFEDDTFTSFQLPATRPNPNRGVSSARVVWSILEDRAGRLWFAAEGRLFRYDGAKLETVSMRDETPEIHVNQILEDAGGDLWFVTQELGIVHYDGKTYTPTQGWPARGLGLLYEDASGALWFLARESGLHRFDGTTLETIVTANEIGAAVPFCMMQDQSGRMWMGGVLGAHRLEGRTLVNVTRDGPW